MLAEFPHCSPVQVYQALRYKCESDTLPSEATVRRYINRWKAENKDFLAYANPDAWKNKQMVAFGKTNEHVERLYQLVEADSTPADVILTDGRYCIVGMIDAYSRQAKLLVAKTSKATAIAALLRRWLLDFGVPEVLKTDNGKDYTSKHMTRVLFELGIEQKLCPPFVPQMKPRIERFFKTFSHDLLELMPGFAGHNVAQRQELRSRQAFGERMFKKSADLELKMTPVELQAFCDNWCVAYHNRPHEGDGMDGRTPQQLVTNWQQPIKRIQNERALDLLLAEAPGGDGIRTITKQGLVIDKVDYIAAGLGAMVGQKVQVRYDPIDLGRVYVFSEASEFICVAYNPERSGIDRREVALAAAVEQKRVVKALKTKMKEAKKQANVKTIGQAIATNAALNNKKVVPIRQSTEEYTPLQLLSAEDALKAASETIPVARERTAAENAALAEVTAQIEATERKQAEVMSHEQKIRWRDKQIAKLAEVFLGNEPQYLSEAELIDVARYATHGAGAGLLKIYVDDDRVPAFRRWMAAFLPQNQQCG